MIGPKHLWSGDWESQSASARAAAEEQRPAAIEPEAATADLRPPPTEVHHAPGAPPPPRRDQVQRRRLTLLAVLGVLGVCAAVAGGLVLADAVDPGPSKLKPLPAVASKPLKPKTGQTRSGAIYARDSPAVVLIRTTGGQGTGFLIDSKGTLVTNDHVVESATSVDVRFGADGRNIHGRVVGADPSSDLAVVRIDPAAVPAGAKPLKLADSSNVQIGDSAIAIGYPFGLDRTATAGIVSGLGRAIQAPNGFSIDSVIQTDAPINPGNSGGPLLDDGGNVIGVNSQIATGGGTSGGNVGIGFAVPSNTVRQVVPRLERGESISRAYLGVDTTQIIGGLSPGALVASLVPGGPADDAGLQVADDIVKIAGQPVTKSEDVATIIGQKHAGDEVQVTVERAGQTLTIGVKLGTRPASVP